MPLGGVSLCGSSTLNFSYRLLQICVLLQPKTKHQRHSSCCAKPRSRLWSCNCSDIWCFLACDTCVEGSLCGSFFLPIQSILNFFKYHVHSFKVLLDGSHCQRSISILSFSTFVSRDTKFYKTNKC